MTYPRPTIRYVRGVYYRPAWAGEDGPSLDGDDLPDFEALCGAFGDLTGVQVRLIGLLLAAGGEPVPRMEFGGEWHQQQRSFAALRGAGLDIGVLRGRRFYLTPQGRKAVLAAVRRVRG